MTTWRSEITEVMAARGETFADVVAMCAAENKYDDDSKPYDDDSWLDLEFDGGYGGTNGAYFTVWTTKRVYFPICYDGAEWASSVSREPDGIATQHMGGG